ncbi:MAG: tyrosine-type recombinase/integrase [Nitrospirota bacterium]
MASLKMRGKIYYAQYNVGNRQKRVSLETTSRQLAKEKIRQIESALVRQVDIPLPTKTPIGDVVEAYIQHMKTFKTARSVIKDMSYLREVFGQVCPSLKIKNEKNSKRARKAYNRNTILVSFIEQITTADLASFISARVRETGIAPKTANRFREILTRLFNWAMNQYGIITPGNINPASKVERYREKAPNIRFLTIKQIQEQLEALKDQQQLQTMVAMYIFAGIRREEALWLTLEDVDLKAGMLRIRAKNINEKFWQPKTKVNRIVPISTTLRTYLENYTPKPTPESWYFSSPQGKRWDVDKISHIISEANNNAKLQWTCLDYRHTFGSQLAMKGESLYKIATLMGNSPEICRRHYAALIPEALINSVEFI